MGLSQYIRIGRASLLSTVGLTAVHGLLREMCCSLQRGTANLFARVSVKYPTTVVLSLLMGQKGLPTGPPAGPYTHLSLPETCQAARLSPSFPANYSLSSFR